ncbi:M48 family metallopeptidase [Sulfurovum sp. bin170]|uniref:YgjP-like metallopeptidase domain-containing protein n=1 Tax=Sulfurovum sp. bin170 TaxID=2695268 RepID=UPI0013DE86E4|nr:YgjP-like metallopeptidase domain-containing protein [Sulfurovum sp. bin170]NEW59966.1 M48 family metallopeptidase [Sulfurovum sp. bin170]
MKLKYLNNYSENLQNQIRELIEKDKLSSYLLSKYPKKHSYQTDKALYSYTQEFKTRFLKKQTLSKVIYDGKINVIHDALGVHTFISRVQGGKLKAKNEIRIGTVFKNMPEEFLRMIVVHELAHFKEKEHNKAFYKFCTYIEPAYHQLEFDLRVYLTYVDRVGRLY